MRVQPAGVNGRERPEVRPRPHRRDFPREGGLGDALNAPASRRAPAVACSADGRGRRLDIAEHACNRARSARLQRLQSAVFQRCSEEQDVTTASGAGQGKDRLGAARGPSVGAPAQWLGRVRAGFLAAATVLGLSAGVVFAQPGPAPDPSNVAIDPAETREVMVSLAQVLRERFAFRARGHEAAAKIEALEQQGAFREARTAAELLALIEQKVTPIVDDRHFRARYFGPEAVAGFSEAPPAADDIAAFHEEVRLRGGEVPEVRWLPGNVGYLRISMFLDAAPSAEQLALAMGMLAHTGALIVDVRGSPGGEPAGVANVIGHFVSARTATVRVQGSDEAAPDRTYYAEPRTPAYTDRPVFVLVDNNTGSGAEEFAYDLQAMRRATLIGETTAGAATPGGYRPLAHGFVAFIPMQIVTNTITGSHWEGVGVVPDVAVPAAEALTRAHRLALEAILKDAQGLQRAIAEEGLSSLEPSPPR